MIKRLKQNQQVIGVSLDIKAAFDNAWWPALLNQLRKTNCPQNLFSLIQDYFKERSVEMSYANATVNKNMTRGCIQGSVCGPVFWNLILDELLSTPLPDGCHIQAFADDVFLIVGANDTPNAEYKTNQALAAISEWGQSVKLTFSPLKTNAIAFTNKASHANISMDGIRIEFQREIKFLGVIIDDKLNFNAHVKYAIKKGHKKVQKALYVCTTHLGSPRRKRHNNLPTSY